MGDKEGFKKYTGGAILSVFTRWCAIEAGELIRKNPLTNGKVSFLMCGLLVEATEEVTSNKGRKDFHLLASVNEKTGWKMILNVKVAFTGDILKHY